MLWTPTAGAQSLELSPLALKLHRTLLDKQRDESWLFHVSMAKSDVVEPQQIYM